MNFPLYIYSSWDLMSASATPIFTIVTAPTTISFCLSRCLSLSFLNS